MFDAKRGRAHIYTHSRTGLQTYVRAQAVGAGGVCCLPVCASNPHNVPSWPVCAVGPGPAQQSVVVEASRLGR